MAESDEIQTLMCMSMHVYVIHVCMCACLCMYIFGKALPATCPHQQQFNSLPFPLLRIISLSKHYKVVSYVISLFYNYVQ